MNQIELINSLRAADIQSLAAYENNKKNMKKNRFNLENYLSRTLAAEPQIIDSPQLAVVEQRTPTSEKVIVMRDAGVPSGAARFNLAIKRESANIDATLPVPTFGALDYETDYQEVIKKYLPEGCTVALARTSDKRGLKLTYTLGDDTDIITIQVKEKPYLSLLRGTQGSLIKLSQMKAKIGDAANEEQFTENVILVTNTLFGRAVEDKMTPDDFFRDDQYVQTMRTISQDIDVDMETTVVWNMAPIANNLLTITTVVQKFAVSRAQNF